MAAWGELGAHPAWMSTVAPAKREALAGLVERVTYHNADNGFCVLRVKVRGQRELVTVIGAAAAQGLPDGGTGLCGAAIGFDQELWAGPQDTADGDSWSGSGRIPWLKQCRTRDVSSVAKVEALEQFLAGLEVRRSLTRYGYHSRSRPNRVTSVIGSWLCHRSLPNPCGRYEGFDRSRSGFRQDRGNRAKGADPSHPSVAPGPRRRENPAVPSARPWSRAARR